MNSKERKVSSFGDVPSLLDLFFVHFSLRNVRFESKVGRIGSKSNKLITMDVFRSDFSSFWVVSQK